MNLLANSTGGTLASAVTARLSFATVGVKAGIDLLAQGYAALSSQNSAVVPEGFIDAFASESAALSFESALATDGAASFDFEAWSAQEAAACNESSSYVPPASSGRDKIVTDRTVSDRSISVGSKTAVDGAGSPISREMRMETEISALEDNDLGDADESTAENRIIQSARRLARAYDLESNEGLAFDEIGAISFIVPQNDTPQAEPKAHRGHEESGTEPVSKSNAHPERAASPDGEPAMDFRVDIVKSASAPKAAVLSSASDLGSRVFVNAKSKTRPSHSRETIPAMIEHVVAHITPASCAIVAREGLHPAAQDFIVSAFSARPGPAGTTSISMIVAPRGSKNRAEIHFTERDGRIEFAGIERRTSMGATQPLPASLPIPTFSPAGILRDGMVEPGYGLPGRARHDGEERDESEAELEERITSLVLDQLRKGPDSSSAAGLLTQLNNYLVNNGLAAKGRAVTPAAWIRMVRRALGLVIRSVPIFDATGLRTAEAVRHDAAAIAGMGISTLRAWEGAFETDLVSEQLFRIPEASDESVESDMTERLESGLRRILPQLAKLAASSDFIDPAIGFAGETNLQWGIAVISAMEGVELKVRAAMDFISSVNRKNPKAACKGMALIIKHSTVSERNLAEQPLFDRWSEAEVRSLIASVMRSEMWDIMSQRAMRKHFEDEPGINAFINEVIFNANYTKAIEELNRIDVTQVSDEAFWDAVERTGVEETLMDNVIARMAQFN